MDAFKNTIKAYLDNRAQTDSLFATTYAKPNKNIDSCCSYIKSQARKQAHGGCAIIQDEMVFNWAIHYYDEDNIKNDIIENQKVDVKISSKKSTKEHIDTPVPEKSTRHKRVKAKLLSNELSLFGDET